VTKRPPSSAHPGYSISGGRADADRLDRQAAVMAAASHAFLARVGLAPGWNSLDVGCGTGQVTLEMAHIVGTSGRVLGVDIDSQAIAMAGELAASAGLRVEFGVADVATGLGEVDTFDLAYARLVLSHLTDPMAALRSMVAAVKPGGTVAIEDLYTGTLRSDPPTAALDRLQDIYCATVRFSGGDPTIGPRLPAMLTGAGLSGIAQTTVDNPMTTPRERFFLAELLDNMRKSILAAGAATAAELAEVRQAVAAAADDPNVIFYQARIHQVSGRRPPG
jgi:SAM-dependent methyltransferase